MVQTICQADAMNTEKHWYEQAAEYASSHFPTFVKKDEKSRKKLAKSFPPEYIDNLRFTGLDVEPREIMILAYAGLLFSFLGFIILDAIILLLHGSFLGSIDLITLVLMFVITAAVPFAIMNYLYNYPISYAKILKIRSLGDIPEILSYLVMYLKLVPNLENSAKFAASESKTSLASDLRKMIWNMEIKIFHGIDEAITEFAEQWGKWSDYFKRSLHLIRNSIREHDEASRTITLDRALDVSLEGTRDLMNKFASKLHQPTMVIYSIGIMIPLSLVAMLPAAGLVGLNITIFHVLFIYDILLPLAIFFYMRKILLSRPATFTPPKIPSDHPDIAHINKKNRLTISMIIGLVIALPGIIFVTMPIFFPEGSSNAIISYIINPEGLNAVLPVTLFFIWGFAAFVTFYCISVYYPYKKVRDDIKQIESEFSDALYILGKRLSEEKSPEECFLHAANTMKGAKIAEVFGQTGYNLTAMHTNLNEAIFSDEFGSLKYVYSDRIRAIMKLFVEGIKKSQQVVSVAIIRIADHLKELQSVENKIKDSLFELTGTLQSTAAMFAPLIAGITVAITKLISKILEQVGSQILGFDMEGTSEVTQLPTTFHSASEAFSIQNVRPEYFVLVIGVYLIILILLLTKFTNGINNGDDKSAFMYTLGKTMPVAVIVYTITLIVARMMFNQMIFS
jgi:hypothetical protein